MGLYDKRRKKSKRLSSSLFYYLLKIRLIPWDVFQKWVYWSTAVSFIIGICFFIKQTKIHWWIKVNGSIIFFHSLGFKYSTCISSPFLSIAISFTSFSSYSRLYALGTLLISVARLCSMWDSMEHPISAWNTSTAFDHLDWR